MVDHFYDAREYVYLPEAQKVLIREWHKSHGLPFPPASGTYYDDVSRQVVQGSYTVQAKTPPPWVGKALGEWTPTPGRTGSLTVRIPKNIDGTFTPEPVTGGTITVNGVKR